MLIWNSTPHPAGRSAATRKSLSSKEYALLEYLVCHKSHIVTRAMICEHVGNEDCDSFTSVIDVYISDLRNKVEKGFKKKLIHTVRGSGYKIIGKR